MRIMFKRRQKRRLFYDFWYSWTGLGLFYCYVILLLLYLNCFSWECAVFKNDPIQSLAMVQTVISRTNGKRKQLKTLNPIPGVLKCLQFDWTLLWTLYWVLNKFHAVHKDRRSINDFIFVDIVWNNKL